MKTEINLIEAVKLVRRFVRLDLKEAKDLVEAGSVYRKVVDTDPQFDCQVIRHGLPPLQLKRLIYKEDVIKAISEHTQFPKQEPVETEDEFVVRAQSWIRRNPVRAIRIASDELATRDNLPF